MTMIKLEFTPDWPVRCESNLILFRLYYELAVHYDFTPCGRHRCRFVVVVVAVALCSLSFILCCRPILFRLYFELAVHYAFTSCGRHRCRFVVVVVAVALCSLSFTVCCRPFNMRI